VGYIRGGGGAVTSLLMVDVTLAIADAIVAAGQQEHTSAKLVG